MKSLFKGVVVVGGLVVILSGCTSGNTSSGADIETGVDAIRDACGKVLRVANADASLPALTQCEVQNNGADRMFILQFADPSTDRIALGQGTTMDTIFIQPLNALQEVWATVASDGGIDTYIVSFQDSCQTVWELPASLVEDFVSDRIDAEMVTNTMLISAIPC